ncbi:hypothetical protein BgiMline_003291 [Biomphalaria glabrata]
MASNTRSKTDSDRKLKIQELTETAALLELEGPSRSDYIRQKLDEWERREFERDTKTKTEDSKPQASTNRAISHQGKNNPPNHKTNQAVHPRPNTPNPANYRSSHPPPKQWCNFHKINSHDTKDCRSRGKPTHTLNSIRNPAPSDAEALVLAAVSAQSGESPHPPSVEKALVNGRAGTCLNDTGCLVEAVVRESLVSPSDYIEETTQIQTVDLESPPKTLPMALINVESKYVRGRIKAIVMKSPAYDLILGCRYVFLGTPPYPSVSAPVLTRSQVQVEESDSLKVNTIPTEIREAQKQDPSLQKYLRFAQEGEPALGKVQFFFKTGLLYRRGKEPDACNQLVVPKPYREQVMQTGHASSLSAHQGQSSTLNRIRFHYFWPGMTENIKRYVASCPQCQKLSPKNRIPPVPLGKTPLIETPFKRVSVDILGPLPRTKKRNAYILCVICQASRWPEAAPLSSIDSKHVAEALFNMFTRIGFPEEILTDNGSQFTGRLMKEVYALFNAKHLRSSVYHPQANGLVERFNHTLVTMLKRLIDDKPEEWDTYLPAALFAYREVPHASLGYSPYQIIFGSHPRGPLEILKQTWTKDQLNDEVKTVSKYVKDLQERLQDIRSLARSNLIKARKRQEKYYNRRAKERSLNVGDKVLLLLPKNTNKLQICWQGPFEVLKKVSPTNYVIKVGRKEKSYHVNLLKHYLERPSQTDPPRDLMAIAVAEDVKEPKDLVEYPLHAVETHENVTISPQLDAEQTAEVKSMLGEFHDVLSDKPGRTSLERFSMKLLSAEPIKVKAYPLPHAKAEVIKQEVEELLKAGIIAPSVSPYNAPVVLVRKPDGGHRMCIDFRRLNAVAEFQAEPLPDPATIFANLSHARYFSKFDLSRGYYQIEVEPECRPLLAFSTPQGHYEFQTVPFGLNNSSSVFTRMMRKLLAPIESPGIQNFIDDILIATETWSEHIALISSLLLRLRETGLTARPSKCLIGFTRLKFLGHVIQENQLMPDEEKVAQLLEAPRPITKTGVRSFLGMCGYYQKFIPHFNSIAAPLSDLTKKDRPDKVTWNEECELAFQRLKEYLTSSPVLKLPDLSRTFVLRTDASGSGLGAVLMQTAEGSGDTLFPVAYASRKLNQAESNYATIELECLALVWAIEKFQAFLYGKHFTLQTDHKPLSYLSSSKHLNARLMRWSLLLQPYSFQVEHVPGSQNAAPDFLSRHCVLEPTGLNGYHPSVNLNN